MIFDVSTSRGHCDSELYVMGNDAKTSTLVDMEDCRAQ